MLDIKSINVLESENLTPYGSAGKLIEEINSFGSIENLLIVSHEPFISQLISMLLSGDTSLNIEMKKAGICKLSIERLVHGRCATLEWLLTATQLAAI